MVEFIYYGRVRGQGRPRFTKNGHAYESAEDKAYKAALKDAYKEQCGKFFAEKPISMKIDVFRSLPKSAPKRIDWVEDTVRPDVDNIAKAVMDALNGVAYCDDSQIVELIVRKHPRRHNDECIIVTVEEA